MTLGIVNQAWEVQLSDPHSPELLVDGIACRGATWCGHQKIYLSKELTRETAKRTIVHELTHACLWSTQAQLQASYSEEYICEFMAIWATPILDTAKEVLDTLFPEEVTV